MGFFYALAIEHLEMVLYALTLLAGVVPEALAVLQRRRRGGLSRRRRRRGGGIFGALGMLLLVFLFGGILILVLGALALFKIIGGRRR